MAKLMKPKKETAPEKTVTGQNGKNKATTTAPQASVNIDFPKNDEKITAGHYAVRITSVGAGFVEISVNKGQWEPCRPAVGYLWYDWWASNSGKYTLVSRITTISGKTILSNPVSCEVVSQKSSKSKK